MTNGAHPEAGGEGRADAEKGLPAREKKTVSKPAVRETANEARTAKAGPDRR